MLEIIGTIGTILFALLVIFGAKVLLADAVPLWVAIAIIVVFGAIAIWAIWKVGSYWWNRIKGRLAKKK